MTATIIRFPFTPRLVGRDTTPIEDLEYALRQSAVRLIKIQVPPEKPADTE